VGGFRGGFCKDFLWPHVNLALARGGGGGGGGGAGMLGM